MLRTLKILYILLNMIMLTKTTSFLEDLEDLQASDNSSLKFVSVHDYVLSNIESAQNYSDNVTVKYEVGNVPSAPGIPISTKLSNFTYYLQWEPAESHDLQVTLYRLEGLIVENNYKEDNHTDKNNQWNLYYNGTNNYWITTRDMNQKYRFRVQAENAYGRGVWSESSAIVDLTLTGSTRLYRLKRSTMQDYSRTLASYYIIVNDLKVILHIIILIMTICTFIIAVWSLCYLCRCNKSSIEYDTLSENHEPNSMQDPIPQSNPDKFPRIIIKKEQITLEKILGSGNFGEVYQGIVENLEKSERTPVAIKKPPKNATLQQKNEFKKEAKIMRDFDHKHVLRLLGTCVDAMDSPWLILELMEAGDLLNYLRESRTLQQSHPQALHLKDLLAMCEDVARGCRYLEEQHYVHRDLACRNCLISARDREHRIIKISNFGLARDIHEKDYYRMGKGTPLSIRWMAPESLETKKFTSQSDVWAFGVLMWEITSLGQQPYADIDNCNVKEHVCAGNKLLKPHHCPEKLYNLMLSCWNIANDRPNFKSCLETIETLKNEIEDTNLHLLPPSEISEYVRVEILPEAQPTETTVLLNV